MQFIFLSLFIASHGLWALNWKGVIIVREIIHIYFCIHWFTYFSNGTIICVHLREAAHHHRIRSSSHFDKRFIVKSKRDSHTALLRLYLSVTFRVRIYYKHFIFDLHKTKRDENWQPLNVSASIYLYLNKCDDSKCLMWNLQFSRTYIV